jgi:type IV pilus assembly protein PilE
METIMKTRAAGFTLIDLLVAVVIIGILSAIAIPMYQNYVTNAKRGQAKSVMLNLSQMEERYYTNNYTYYAVSSVPPTADPNGWSNYAGQSMTGRTYDIAVTTTPAPPASSTAFLITATPSNGFADATCGALTLDNFGNKGSVAGNSSPCW